MDLEELILPQKPSNWQIYNGNYDNVYIVQNHTTEFTQVDGLITAKQNYKQVVTKIHRVQNCNFYCQFKCRREFYARTQQPYYSVRQFLKIEKDKLASALKYNLDPRRLSLNELKFNKELCYTHSNEIILVVHVLTKFPSDDTTPIRDTDYYIEYIVYFD